MMKSHTIFLTMLSFILLATNVYAETTQCVEITSVPATIDQPGIYCLQQSLSSGSIVINADDVTLDMNRHSLSNFGNVGIRLLGDRVTVKNGTVRSGNLGVNTVGNQNLVENMQISDTTGTGIYISGRDTVVRNNRLTNLTAVGIYCSGPSDWRPRNQIIGNTLNNFVNNGGGANAIWLSRCGMTTVEDNTVFSSRYSDWYSNTNLTGIHITHSNDVLVVNNRLSHWYRGIWYSTSTSGKYMSNLSTSVATPFTGGVPVGDNN